MTRSSPIPFFGSRQGCVLVVLLASLLALPGCWVSSVNGLDEGRLFRPDPDITFDDSLIGTWRVTEESCTTVLTISGSDRTYNLESVLEGEKCEDAGQKGHYLARLVKLDSHFFLDVYPRPDDVCEACLALHWIFLAKFDKSALTMVPIDSEWLKNASEKTVILVTMPEDTDVITASAKELKAFCRKYADNQEVFKPIPGLLFKRK